MNVDTVSNLSKGSRMLETLKRNENHLGTLGTILAIVMFTSLIEVAWSNYQDKSIIWIQPTISTINSTVWCLYAVARADKFLFLANTVGIFFAVLTILAIFL